MTTDSTLPATGTVDEGLPCCVPWDARYREGVLELFKEVPYKRQLWQWQFESNPFGLPFNPIVLVDGEDNVVGFNGVMPVRIADRGEEIPAVWSCDFYLAEQWRGQGLGSHVKHELHKKSPLIMAFGISDRASDVLRHLGWVPDDSVRTYRMLRRRSGLRSWLLTGLQWLNRMGRGFACAPGASSISVDVSSTLPDKGLIDDLWTRCYLDYGRVVQRDFAYLNWRYQQHPLSRYAFALAWRNSELAAVLIVRFSRQTLRIVDYCGPCKDRSLKRTLVRAAVRHWPHATQVIGVTSDSELGSSFLAEGFVQLRDRPRFYIYEACDGERAEPAPWFIMAGDSDGEFLQAAGDFCTAEKLPGMVASERVPC